MDSSTKDCNLSRKQLDKAKGSATCELQGYWKAAPTLGELLSLPKCPKMGTTGVRPAVWRCPKAPATRGLPVEGRMEDVNRGGQESNLQDRQDEARKIRRLQVMISMVMSVISQDPNLTIEEASELSANARRAALAMFPGKELAFDILYKPRLQRLMMERFRIQ